MGASQRLIYTAALVFLACAPARAQEQALPLGLEKFRWGMNLLEATRYFSSIGGIVPGPANMGLTDHTLVYFAPYRWQSCSFAATLAFSNGALDHVSLQLLDAGEACAGAILESLRAAYGSDSAAINMPYPEPRIWKTASTDAIFNVRVWLGQAGAPPITAYDTGELDRGKQ